MKYPIHLYHAPWAQIPHQGHGIPQIPPQGLRFLEAKTLPFHTLDCAGVYADQYWDGTKIHSPSRETYSLENLTNSLLGESFKGRCPLVTV